MNKQLIEKVVKSNNEKCPSFSYENPLLDRGVAEALSKSFLRMLKMPGLNYKVNSNLRLSVLENIRKICRIEAENHLKIDEGFTEIITHLYQKNLKESTSSENTTDEMLDAFLIRRFISTDLESSIKSSANVEIIQALNNLDESGDHVKILSKDMVHWRNTSSKNRVLLKEMWNNDNIRKNLISSLLLDDISLKLKEDIEMTLLETCYKILEHRNIDIEELFTSDPSLLQLIKTSAKSPKCFQICSNVLNLIFIETHFDDKILSIISIFVSYVKLHSLNASFSNLYPSSISNVVLLLDIDLNELPSSTHNEYINITMEYLKSLHENCESQLILLLSHFSDWFDVYFDDR